MSFCMKEHECCDMFYILTEKVRIVLFFKLACIFRKHTLLSDFFFFYGINIQIKNMYKNELSKIYKK